MVLAGLNSRSRDGNDAALSNVVIQCRCGTGRLELIWGSYKDREIQKMFYFLFNCLDNTAFQN